MTGPKLKEIAEVRPLFISDSLANCLITVPVASRRIKPAIKANFQVLPAGRTDGVPIDRRINFHSTIIALSHRISIMLWEVLSPDITVRTFGRKRGEKRGKRGTEQY